MQWAIFKCVYRYENRYSFFGIVTAVLENSRVQISAEDEIFSFLQNVQTGSEACPASYAVGTETFSREVK
jgi:hypothetical protein